MPRSRIALLSPRLVNARRTPDPFTGWRGFLLESRFGKKAMPRNIIPFPHRKTTVIKSMNVGDVNLNANVGGNIAITIRKQRPKIAPIPVDDPITPENKTVLKELAEKIVCLAIIAGKYQESRRAFGSVRDNLNKVLGVTTINECRNENFRKGRDFLQIWLFTLLTNDKVIKNPPDWWRDYLKAGIHINLQKNRIDEHTYENWMVKKYAVDSSMDLPDKELAELFNYSKTGKFDLTRINENPRDFTLRHKALITYFDEREAAGNFSRKDVRMNKKELLEELQKRDKTLFSIALPTFAKFVKEAKKIDPFKLKDGRPSTVKL